MQIRRSGITLNCYHNNGSGGVLYLESDDGDKQPARIKLSEKNYDLLCRFLCDVKNAEAGMLLWGIE